MRVSIIPNKGSGGSVPWGGVAVQFRQGYRGWIPGVARNLLPVVDVPVAPRPGVGECDESRVGISSQNSRSDSAVLGSLSASPIRSRTSRVISMTYSPSGWIRYGRSQGSGCFGSSRIAICRSRPSWLRGRRARGAALQAQGPTDLAGDRTAAPDHQHLAVNPNWVALGPLNPAVRCV